MDGHLTRLAELGCPGATWSPTDAEFYRNYEVDLRSLTLRNEARPKNQISTAQYELMAQSLADLRSQHKSACPSTVFLDQSKLLFNTSWKAIVELELAKKRGES